MNTEKAKNPVLGIFLCVISFLGVAIISGFVKASSHAGLATQQILFFQSVIALIFLLPWILKTGKNNLIPKNKVLIVVRSFIGLTFLYLFYLSVRLVPLVNAVLLRNTSPLFIPIIAFFFAKKKITLKVLSAMIIGFIGVLLVLNPGRGFLRPGDLLALSAGFIAAVGTMTVKHLENKGETVPTMMLYYLVITLIVTGIAAIPVWKNPEGIVWLYLAIIGIVYAIYQVLYLTAIKLASPVIIAPFIYFGVVFSGIVDWIGWKQKPDLMTVIGSIVVILSAVISTIHRSGKIGSRVKIQGSGK